MRNRTLAIYEDHPLCDTEAGVVAFLTRAAEDGRLVTHPEVIRRSFRRLPDGRIAVPVTVKVPVVRRSHPVAREVGVALGKAALLVSVLGALVMLAVWGLSVLAGAVVAAVHGRAVMGVLGLMLALWLIVSLRRRCPGLHCGGCKDH